MVFSLDRTMEGMFLRKREAGSDLEEVSNPSKRIFLDEDGMEGEESLSLEREDEVGSVSSGEGFLSFAFVFGDDGGEGDVEDFEEDGERIESVFWEDDGGEGDMEDFEEDGERESVFWEPVSVYDLPRRPPPLEPGSDSGDDEYHRGLPLIEPGPDSGVEEVYLEARGVPIAMAA